MSEVAQTTDELVPWLEPQFKSVIDRADKQVLPHALLLGGEKYQGKTALANAIARYMLCRTRVAGNACGECKGCLLFNAGSHPDLKLVEPQDSRFIVVDSIRGLIDWANQTAQQGGHKVVIIKPAEAMNIAAANALLKCLEEPVANTLIILVSDRPGSLLATIRSRCQRVLIPNPDRATAMQWLGGILPAQDPIRDLLESCGGKPLKALEMHQLGILQQRDTIQSVLGGIWSGKLLAHEGASQLIKFDPEQVVDLFYYWLVDMLKSSQSGKELDNKNKEMQLKFNLICEKKGLTALYRFHDHLSGQRAALLSASNPNKQLLIESVLIDFANLAKGLRN
jgi:DNA polymerase-3 subunit delta'